MQCSGDTFQWIGVADSSYCFVVVKKIKALQIAQRSEAVDIESMVLTVKEQDSKVKQLESEVKKLQADLKATDVSAEVLQLRRELRSLQKQVESSSINGSAHTSP